MPDDLSRLRQRLHQRYKQLGELLHSLLAMRTGIIRGTLGVRARVCGHANCKCTRGELHQSKYLSVTVGGRVRQVHIPASDELKVAEGVQRYQTWRRTRGAITELNTELLRLADALGVALLADYPPEAPIPPARKRGRKPKSSP